MQIVIQKQLSDNIILVTDDRNVKGNIIGILAGKTFLTLLYSRKKYIQNKKYSDEKCLEIAR